MSTGLFQLKDLFRALAQQLKEALAVEPSAAGWTDAFIDVRYSSDGSHWARNTEATVAGLPVSLPLVSGRINELLQNIWQARLDEPFYGFVLSLNARGEVDVRLNYDLNCFSDPSFWAV